MLLEAVVATADHHSRKRIVFAVYYYCVGCFDHSVHFYFDCFDFLAYCLGYLDLSGNHPKHDLHRDAFYI